MIISFRVVLVKDDMPAYGYLNWVVLAKLSYWEWFVSNRLREMRRNLL